MAYSYLPQSRPLCPKVRLPVHNTREFSTYLSPDRILDTISAEREEEILDNASIISDRHTASSVRTDPETHRIAAEKHAEYSAMLAPVLELEGRLIHRLREDDDEDEATHLGDGSTPGWSTPRGEYAVRTTSNWKRAFSIRRTSRSKRITSTSWWDDPADPVHVLDRCRDAMVRLWGDEWVRRRLMEKRIRLQESSGLCVRIDHMRAYDALISWIYSYLDQIERITGKDYSPTDGAFSVYLPSCYLMNHQRMF